MARAEIALVCAGPARGGFRGYIVPGPVRGGLGLGRKGPGRVQVYALSFGIAP